GPRPRAGWGSSAWRSTRRRTATPVPTPTSRAGDRTPGCSWSRPGRRSRSPAAPARRWRAEAAMDTAPGRAEAGPRPRPPRHADEAAGLLGTDPATGLDAGEVAERRRQYGPNRLPEAARQGPLGRLLDQFRNVLVVILIGAGVIKLLAGLWLDAAV